MDKDKEALEKVRVIVREEIKKLLLFQHEYLIKPEFATKKK